MIGVYAFEDIFFTHISDFYRMIYRFGIVQKRLLDLKPEFPLVLV